MEAHETVTITKEHTRMSKSNITVDVSAFLAEMQAIASDTSVTAVAARVKGTDTANVADLLDNFYASGASMLAVEESDVIGWTHNRKGSAPTQASIAEVYVLVRNAVAADTRPFAVQKAGDTILLLNPLAGEDSMEMVADEVRRLTGLRNHNAAIAENGKRSTKERAAARKRAATHGRTLDDLLARIAGNIA